MYINGSGIISEYIAGAILGLVIIYIYQEVKYYLKEEERKRNAIKSAARYDAYRKERDEYFKTHEYVNLTSADGDEFFIGSEFLMRKKS